MASPSNLYVLMLFFINNLKRKKEIGGAGDGERAERKVNSETSTINYST
jgi:hypothetical protein